MASLPGFPGSLGMPPSGNPSNSDSSFDLPSGAPGSSSAILLANRTFFSWGSDPTHLSDLSGSFSIPATTAGNLLVVFVTNGDPTTGGTGTIADSAADMFTQVPWYSIAGSNAVAGQMSAFSTPLPDGSGGFFPSVNGLYDAWYTNTTGGATSIIWAYSDDLRGAGFTQPIVPEFWVYELSPAGTWSLIVSAATVTGLADEDSGGDQIPPFLGPSLNSTSSHNAYFSMVGANQVFTEGAISAGTVAPPWLLDNDPAFGVLGAGLFFGGAGVALAYILDSTGTQQAICFGSFNAFDYTSCGVVFSCSGATSGGDIDQPNVCIPTS